MSVQLFQYRPSMQSNSHIPATE